MRKTATILGPRDAGRHMNLDEFDHAEVQPGYVYELGRGVIVVSDVPNLYHFAQVNASRRQFAAYDLAYPGRIHAIASGSDCKLLVSAFGSERHPDIAIYKSPPQRVENPWASWIPDILLEIVSAESRYRDYFEKRDEYWDFGVREYWIIEAAIREMRVLKRGDDDWIDHVIRPPKLYKTRILPNFAFDCVAVFEAAEAAGMQNGEST
jgi:Uma2 family endonuclease